MALSSRQLVPTLALSALACGHIVAPPPEPPRLPFVEAALMAGAAATTVRVGWVDRRLPGSTIPAPPGLVDLVLSNETTAGSAPLTPHGDTLFVAALPIQPGHRYRLAGRIGEVTIHATTTVPAAFSIEAPTGDSILLAPTVDDFMTATVDYRWHAVGATAFVVDSAWFPPAQSATRAPVGQMILPRRRAGTPRRLLRIVAVNRDLDEYLYRTPAPGSNVIGGFGVLGGAIAIERWLVTR